MSASCRPVQNSLQITDSNHTLCCGKISNRIVANKNTDGHIMGRVSYLFVAATSVFCLLSTGCSSETGKDDVKEIPVAAIVSTDLPEGELVTTAKEQFEQGLYSVAVNSFEALANSFPLGPYAEFARIKMADCNFKLGRYEDSATLYEEFTKNHPASPSRPYALLMAARSLQLNNDGVGRDVEPLRRSKDLYTKLIEDHPDSIYTQAAKVHRRESMASIARSEQLIADFYRRTGNEKAYLARNTHFNTHWAGVLEKPAPDAIPEILMVNNEVPEAPDADSHPGETMRARLSERNATNILENLENQTVADLKAAVADSTPDEEERGKKILLKKVQCQKSPAAAVFLTFSRPLSDAQLEELLGENNRLEAKDDTLAIRIEGLSSRFNSRSCFEENDLTISKDGEIALSSSRDATLFSLSHPPRLMMKLE